MGELESILLINLLAIFFSKSFNPSCSVQKFLFPSEERMAIGTDLHMDLLLGTLRFEGGSAGTFNHCIKKFGMNILFHLSRLHILFYPLLKNFQLFLPSYAESHGLQDRG